jgi:hypothetical protein
MIFIVSRWCRSRCRCRCSSSDGFSIQGSLTASELKLLKREVDIAVKNAKS